MIFLPKFYKKCNKSDKNDNQDIGTVAIYLLTGEGNIWSRRVINVRLPFKSITYFLCMKVTGTNGKIGYLSGLFREPGAWLLSFSSMLILAPSSPI